MTYEEATAPFANTTCGKCAGSSFTFGTASFGVYRVTCKGCGADGSWLNAATGEVYQWNTAKATRRAKATLVAMIEDADDAPFRDTGW